MTDRITERGTCIFGLVNERGREGGRERRTYQSLHGPLALPHLGFQLLERETGAGRPFL